MVRRLGFGVAAVLSALMLTSAGVAVAGTPDRSAALVGACTNWVQQKSQNRGSGENFFNGVVAISPTDAWAVGGYFVGASTVTLTEHWNGKSWSMVKSPNVDTGDQLYSVYAVSATNIWAAGSSYNGVAGQTLIEHWNGKSWSVVPSPNVGAGTNELFSIRGTSANGIWAVGDTVTNYPTAQTLIEHWTGKHWRVTPSPSGGKFLNVLNAVRPLSATDAWAVGDYEGKGADKTMILHWDGKHWKLVPSPNVGSQNNTLRGIRVTSATAAFAVGNWNNGTADQTLILAWNGSRWRVMPSPNVGKMGNDLYAIGGTSAANAYAVGNTEHGTGTTSLILHWDGSHWRTVPGANPGADNNLDAVYPLSATSIWAVGSFGGSPAGTLIEHCG
jgi:hypothetical protein